MLYTHVLSLTHLHTYPIPKSRSLSQNMYMRRSLLYYCSAVNLSMWIEPEELINTERPLRKRKPTSIFYPRSCRTNYPWNPAAVFLRFITVWLYCSAVVSINFKCQSPPFQNSLRTNYWKWQSLYQNQIKPLPRPKMSNHSPSLSFPFRFTHRYLKLTFKRKGRCGYSWKIFRMETLRFTKQN
jgi:hypothetical protein